jgi:RHS repeat-associated protein
VGALTGSASPTSSFTYNTKGQATSITANSVTLSSMAYADVAQSERTASTNGANTTNFLATPLGLDRSLTGTSATDVVRDSGGNPIGFRDSSGGHWYYLLDGLGSVVGMVNGDGSTLTDKYVYDEFGRVTSKTEATPQPLGYAAGITDPTGLVKFGMRYDDPNLGRWTQRDPLPSSVSRPSTFNAYAYVGNDPLNGLDPGGASRLSRWFKAITRVSQWVTSGNEYLTVCRASPGILSCDISK